MSKKNLLNKFLAPVSPKKKRSQQNKFQFVGIPSSETEPKTIQNNGQGVLLNQSIAQEFQENKVGVAKRGRGKKKIPIEYIDKPQRRVGTFNKRLKGAMKKIIELQILCGAEVITMIRQSETGELFHVSNIVDEPNFIKDFYVQATHNVEQYKRFSDDSYGRGIEDLHTLSAGIRKKKKAGRKKKINPEEEKRRELERFSALPEPERKLQMHLYQLSKKRYVTTSMVNRDIPSYGSGVNGANPSEETQGEQQQGSNYTFQRIQNDTMVREVHQLSYTGNNSNSEYRVDNSVNLERDTGNFTVRQEIHVTMEHLCSTLNDVSLAILQGKDIPAPTANVTPTMEQNEILEVGTVPNESYNPNIQSSPIYYQNQQSSSYFSAAQLSLPMNTDSTLPPHFPILGSNNVEPIGAPFMDQDIENWMRYIHFENFQESDTNSYNPDVINYVGLEDLYNQS